MLLQFWKNSIVDYQRVTNSEILLDFQKISRRWILLQGNRGCKNQNVRKTGLIITK